MNAEIQSLTNQAKECADLLIPLEHEICQVIAGQKNILERLIIALIADGHVLLEGVPGIAKTLMIKTLAQCIDTGFCRIQFTPDLLPADITGTKIYNQQDCTFKTVKGPVFTQFLLADEINRAPPKVQSALLEAMQERQVTIQGETYALPDPFFVLATENPIEHEGTYPLPEAQMDRFMFKVLMGYPSKSEELLILDRFTEGVCYQPKPVISASDIKKIQTVVPSIYADLEIKKYVTSLVDATRNPKEYQIPLASYIRYGASPRASIYLMLGAKAHAILRGRGFVIPDDVKAVAHDVLRHRILLSYLAEAEEITVDSIIDQIIRTVPVP
ncbi:MoxR family ATPase [Methanospirillum hungatei]|jgi:MoxR-like ATPase|uniref:AAA family ATPase n=1 Tax=Methanospirillum hungatei TaxID=2203 RepID=UPI0009CA6CAF|nr:MoxR family ATPase [Methanospirillum hungatei]MBP7034139.1 MoxR family ATPase [Methanospirillum sp.]MBP9007399.1 MoxR family ATPase [Methanospirillum sp.]OQA60389.1 MAG: ATPase family associated with various cellular activities (AAA) [Euryarchaeota archaeon ADurb.Bin294]HOW04722.1 MoxR family ATPase [Methanospirillum hungatei]